MTLDAVAQAAHGEHLAVLGALHDGGDTVVLLGPDLRFWQHFTASPEYADGASDPMNRWSERVIGAMAARLEATALYPFGGPPWHPFIQWAAGSGRAWSSPVGLLVHETAGLMVSYRGALRFAGHLALPAPRTRPCDACADQPCRTACPVDALTADSYDVPRCKAYLRTEAGQDCVEQGCLARRACPVSQQFDRPAAQSEFHMRAFLG